LPESVLNNKLRFVKPQAFWWLKNGAFVLKIAGCF